MKYLRLYTSPKLAIHKSLTAPTNARAPATRHPGLECAAPYRSATAAYVITIIKLSKNKTQLASMKAVRHLREGVSKKRASTASGTCDEHHQRAAVSIPVRQARGCLVPAIIRRAVGTVARHC